MATLAETLVGVLGRDVVDDGDLRPYLSDETESRSLVGRCDAVVRPRTTDEVVATIRWAYAHDVPVVPRGGGTGYAGGAVPIDGGIVLGLDRLDRVRRFDPLLWRMEVEAGLTTFEVRRRARESGLYFPPDPGAGEQSQIGGNIATNAGGPHAFKYGTTGAWVTGVEAVVPPGDVITVGGAFRKDVAGYDLKHVLIGSEGTLGVITAAWLRLIPAPEVAYPILALYPSLAGGITAIETVLGTGLLVSALEFIDGGALAASPLKFLGQSQDAEFCVLCEVDGTVASAATLRDDVIAVLGEEALLVHAPTEAVGVDAVWRWREGMTGAVNAQRGGKVSEDIVVPVDRLGEAIEQTRAIGVGVGLPACSWGHAGDGNLHSTFLIDKSSARELAAAERAAEQLFALAIDFGGSITGEHGIGLAKRGHLEEMWSGRAYELHKGVKSLFDPKGLLNPGKKE